MFLHHYFMISFSVVLKFKSFSSDKRSGIIRRHLTLLTTQYCINPTPWLSDHRVFKSRLGGRAFIFSSLVCGTSSQFYSEDTLSTFNISLKTFDESYSYGWTRCPVFLPFICLFYFIIHIMIRVGMTSVQTGGEGQVGIRRNRETKETERKRKKKSQG